MDILMSMIRERSIGSCRRRAVPASGVATHTLEPLFAAHTLPMLVQARAQNLDLRAWALGHEALIESLLDRHGAILLRGFSLGAVEGLPAVAEALVGPPLPYVFRSTPRTEVTERIYTSTEYPADAHIPQHNENSYQSAWPLRLVFFCMVPAAWGGETPVADSRRVLGRLSPRLVARFEEHGVRYVRNYVRDGSRGFDLPWPEVFQTEDRAEVEAYCRAHDIEFAWGPHDRLRTWQRRPALVHHPRTGERVWFNQAHLFHPSALPEAVRGSLLELYREDELPRNAYLGDGSPLCEDEMSDIRAAFAAEAVSFPWERHDVLLLDNVLASHGRSPYRGARSVLVAMARLVTAAVEGDAR